MLAFPKTCVFSLFSECFCNCAHVSALVGVQYVSALYVIVSKVYCVCVCVCVCVWVPCVSWLRGSLFCLNRPSFLFWRADSADLEHLIGCVLQIRQRLIGSVCFLGSNSRPSQPTSLWAVGVCVSLCVCVHVHVCVCVTCVFCDTILTRVITVYVLAEVS